ncbi:MAG: HD domain-containing protein [Alicyclobacillus sp.]|nr:HD domain-containing protein [Alicyclobacillus sp.]
MKIIDTVYGEFEIEGVLARLIHSGPVQRLKGIHQGGASYLVNDHWNVTRFEHSVGAMLLVRKLGGSLQEQVAALLHDVSHTAFSHVVDYVLERENEDYHESIFEQVVNMSEIPEILEQHGMDWRSVLLNQHQWTILEQPAPNLCADRIDYTLRDLLRCGTLENAEVDQFVGSLIVVDGNVCVKGLPAAEWFVDAYYKEVIGYFMDPLNVYANEILSRTLRAALEAKIISLEDFLGTDDVLIGKLFTSGNRLVNELLARLTKHVRVVETSDHDIYDVRQYKKVRLIDPLVLIDGEVCRASVLSERVRALTAWATEKSLAGTYVRLSINLP